MTVRTRRALVAAGDFVAKLLPKIESLEERRLLSSGFAALAGEADDLGPALDEAVVGERFGCPFLPLAQRVEAVG